MWVGWRFSSPKLAIFRVVIEAIQKLAIFGTPSLGILKKSIFPRKQWGFVSDPPLKLNISGVVIEVARKLVRMGLPLSRLLKPSILPRPSMDCCRMAISSAQIDHYLLRN